jgi:cell division septum initiation protein DivIVA
MTALDSREELVPLRTDFDVVWRGFNRAQVRQYSDDVETKLQLMTADRDALASYAEDLVRRLEAAVAENIELRGKIDQISRIPIEPDALQERSRRMIELTREEADEITARAQAAAEHSRVAAEEAAERQRDRYEHLLAEMDTRREEMESEHRDLMRRTRTAVEATTQLAEQHRRYLDQESARQREQTERDFEKAMAVRRAEALRTIAGRDAAARTHSDGLIGAAGEKARRMVSDAEREVHALLQVRARLSTELKSCGQLMADALPLLEPLPGETAPGFPQQRGTLPPEPPGSTTT